VIAFLEGNSKIELCQPVDQVSYYHHQPSVLSSFISDIAIFVLKRDVKLQLTFELQAKMEEIDLEKCNFRKFRSPVTLTLDRVEVTLVHISGRDLLTNHITSKSEKHFVDAWTDTPEFTKSIRSLPGDDLTITVNA